MAGKSTTDGGADALVSRVGADLEDGLLPLRVFNDPGVHRLECERIFGRSWVFIGHETEIPDEGDYARRFVADNPFVFVRDEHGEIRVLFDSCRHHGTKICDADQGNTSHFRCPYHGWTYSNTGELVGVPQKEEAYGGLDKSEWSLHEAPRVDSYHGLVFASLAGSGPLLEEHLGDFTWYLDLHLNAADGGMEVLGPPHRWEADIDWKSGSDNFAGDSYHTQITHQSLFETGIAETDRIGTKAHEEGGFEHVHVTHCSGHSTSMKVMPEGTTAFWGYPEEVTEHFSRDGLTDAQWDVASRTLNTTGNVFPNLSLIHIRSTDSPRRETGSFLSLRKWRPLGPGRMQIWSWILAPKAAPDAYKRRAYRVGTSTFSPSGNFEQDDLAVWDGIATAANSTFAKQLGVTLNYQMGMEGMSEAEVIPDWPGPGVAYDNNLEEGVSRTFHERWYAAMTGGVP